MGRRLVRLTPQRGWLAARRFPLGAVGWLHCRWRWRLDWPRVTRPWQAQRCSPPLSERLPPCCGAAACRL
ncbi:hypothetical protein EMIHUDRAFT_371164 [Emiliania huxleyi CCMP1516]|uniref:Uncharacterized protein n=2 Tax=Emiliania huxleyi TaxID=2903 RepID=A0A0D3IPQ3_EMIH1|nr:hypothetical protein EMIHUDRAFT_371164 [Emiliania huxleyi CCMP1516]EOD13238.1 hypothetical protein EMIHUDRAFT_371164 [Emiliania huxleyi CCMP1516]|eukprot:XP_005765667.1 hypothetical protein EMIHUDRAFT_371164 [Emiliania huxleyi CCMP1516]